jgi:hypothetical protein
MGAHTRGDCEDIGEDAFAGLVGIANAIPWRAIGIGTLKERK